MSVITCPQVSIRTVRIANGDVSKNGLVRFTYTGVLSIRWKVSMDSPSRSSARITVPNQVRKSRFSDAALLTNSQMPAWIRIADSATIDSSTVHNAHAYTAWENGCAWIGRYHDGQMAR